MFSFNFILWLSSLILIPFFADVTDTGGNLPPVSNLPPSIVDTGVKYAIGINNTRKKFEMILMLFSGAWGKIIHDKT
jgi:hypothetical protein